MATTWADQWACTAAAGMADSRETPWVDSWERHWAAAKEPMMAEKEAEQRETQRAGRRADKWV